jgi:hypothetical protein
MPWLVSANLLSLSMTNCSLRFLPISSTSLPKLKTADFRDNTISLMTDSTADFVSRLSLFYMNGNPTKCDKFGTFTCLCAPGYFGIGFCEPTCQPPTDPRFTLESCSSQTSLYYVGTRCNLFFKFPYAYEEAIDRIVCRSFTDMETAVWSISVSMRRYEFNELFTLRLDKICFASNFNNFDCSNIFLQFNMSFAVDDSVASDVHLLLARSCSLTAIPMMRVSLN